MEATASEIHAYPLRPGGFAEPLFHTAESRKRILEHLAESSWLFRASETRRPEMKRPEAVSVYTGRGEGRVVASWREVDRWWEPGGGVNVIWRRIETWCGRQEVMAEPARAA